MLKKKSHHTRVARMMRLVYIKWLAQGFIWTLWTMYMAPPMLTDKVKSPRRMKFMGCFWWLRIEIKRPPCCREFRLVDKDRVHKNISLYVYMHIYELDPNYTWCTTLVEFQRPKYIHKRYRTWTKSNTTASLIIIIILKRIFLQIWQYNVACVTQLISYTVSALSGINLIRSQATLKLTH